MATETQELSVSPTNENVTEEVTTEQMHPLSPIPTDEEKAAGESQVYRICAVCGACNARRCTNCNQISYCGKEHQREHWKTHKENCFPVQVVDRLSLSNSVTSCLQGRSRTHILVATRDIQQGEVFFRENIILAAPGPWDTEAIEVAKGRPICVSCCEIIKGYCDIDDDDDDEEDGMIRCSQCHWPVCNHFCETAKRHTEYECKVLSSNHVSSMVLNQMPDYECILVLRALGLKEYDSERWMQLLNLDSPVDACMDSENASLFLNSSVKFIREKCGLKQYSDNLIRRVASICYVNALRNEDHAGDNGYIYKIATYIGDTSSTVAHSCTGNSEWAVIPTQEDQIRFRALVPIKSGDPITMTYYSSKHLNHRSTQTRQNDLSERFFLTCSCLRCNDPTELTTYVSAVKCTLKSCEGYLLPTEPRKSSSTWSCGLCNKIESSKQVQLILSAVSQKLDLYPYKDPMRAVAKQMDDTKRTITGLKKLVNKFGGTRLHPNHYLLLEAEWKLIQNCYHYIMNVKQWTPDVVNLIISIGKKHLTVFDKLSPGISRRRGYILYFLQIGLLESIRHSTSALSKKHKKHKVEMEPEKHEALKKAYTEIVSMRNETVRIFSFKGEVKNSMEEELVNFSLPDQPFISCLRHLERILAGTVDTKPCSNKQLT